MSDVFFYVQHLLGIGHQRRAAAITRAMCTLGIGVTYVSGGFPVRDLDVGAARFVQLDPVGSADATYKRFVDAAGIEVDDAWRARRRGQLLRALDTCSPRVIVLETYPFGRRMMRFELLPLLERARAMCPRPVVICSVRDIVEPRTEQWKNRWMVAQTLASIDKVMVHSDERVVPFERFFPLAQTIKDYLCYTGYVVERVSDAPPTDDGRGDVLVSAGGGTTGRHFLDIALAAQPLCTSLNAHWRAMVSTRLPVEQFERLSALCSANLTVEHNRPDFPALLANCRVSVSQAGYNTMLESVSARARAIVVPFDDDGEQEQSLRARAFEQHGLLNVISKQELTPRRLAGAITEIAAKPRPAPGGLAIDGAERAAAIVGEYLA